MRHLLILGCIFTLVWLSCLAQRNGGNFELRPRDPNLLELNSIGGGFNLNSLTPNGAFWGGGSRRLIFDGSCGRGGRGRWITVTRNQCPIAFDDPTFRLHNSICNDNGWAGLYRRGRNQVMSMWTYPEWDYCRNVPSCLACPILGTCPRRQGGGGGGGRRCRCNGFIGTNPSNRRQQGQCMTEQGGRYYCYVDRNSRCTDRRRSQTFTGRGSWWSYNACFGNRRPREDDDNDNDAGPLWRSLDDDEEEEEETDDFERVPRAIYFDEDNDAVDETNVKVEVIEEIMDA